MCGIAGIFYADRNRPVDRALLAQMGESIAHRGPDAQGIWSEPGFGMVHRRLSIIDLAGGSQPMPNEDESVFVAFNGEIYNYRALRADLTARGHRFATQSDTEVLVHLFEDRQERLVNFLRGMFAFAAWDRKNRRLLLARDRVGLKPLYYYRDAEQLIFASELKAILIHPGVGRSIDREALEDYLTFGFVPGPRSIFQHIHKLPPAHTVLIDDRTLNTAAPRRYWQLRYQADPNLTEEQWCEALDSKLSESVKLHLASDVPVGAFLSGGLDSSAIVAHCSGLTAGRLETFSMGFENEECNELSHARQVANAFDTEHREEIVSTDCHALIDDLSRFFDEPFADPSAIATLQLAKLTRRHVKVALSGDGGDEAFGGYARYAHDLKETAVRHLLPTWFRQTALRPLAASWPSADWVPRPLRAKSVLTNLSLEDGNSYATTLSIGRGRLPRQLMNRQLSENLNGHAPHAAVRAGYSMASDRRDALTQMIAADVHVMLPDDFLVKIDRASMAYGLEVRPPLLDHELLELAMRIPSRFKIHRGKTKWVFKQACRRRLPASIIDRRKHGFDVPVDQWLRGPLGEMFQDCVLSSSAPVGNVICQDRAQALFRSHVAGMQCNGPILWSLLVLARWTERYRPAA